MRPHAAQQSIQRTPDDGQVPPGVTHSRRRNIVSITIPREYAGSSRSVANVVNAVLESAYVARNRRLANGMLFLSRTVTFLNSVPPDLPRISFAIRLVREGGRVNRIEFADTEMQIEEAETITGEAPRRSQPPEARPEPRPEQERQPGEWYIENNRLYPGFRISAFRSPGAGAGAGATVDISTVSVNSVGTGWCTFIREYANDVVVFARLDEISQERIRVTWFRFQNTRVTPYGVNATHPASMDRGEIGNRLSFERAQHLRFWQPIMVGVAWGTASVLTLGLGPGAGVVGQGSALAGEGFLVNAIAGGLGGAITQFLYESMQSMIQAEDPAHFYSETNWSQFARRVIISAITNAVGGGVGDITIPGGGYGFFDHVARFLAQYIPRVTTNMLGTLANRMFDDVDRQEAVRRLRERYRSASVEDRQEIDRQLRQMIRQHSTSRQGDVTNTIRDLWVQALQSVPAA
jgi:hypothetical protein